MPVSNVLKRLLRIRDLEQEQHRIALESALTELRTLEDALSAATERERSGRGQFSANVNAGESLARQSALVESLIGEQHILALGPALSRAEAEAARHRYAFLLKRVEHRQAETLIQESKDEDLVEDIRMSQQKLDDWFLARVHRIQKNASSTRSSEELSTSETAADLKFKNIQE